MWKMFFVIAAKQQTNFGHVRDTYLPRFQVIEIEALSIRKKFDHQSGIDVKEKIRFSCRKARFRGQRV